MRRRLTACAIGTVRHAKQTGFGARDATRRTRATALLGQGIHERRAHRPEPRLAAIGRRCTVGMTREQEKSLWRNVQCNLNALAQLSGPVEKVACKQHQWRRAGRGRESKALHFEPRVDPGSGRVASGEACHMLWPSRRERHARVPGLQQARRSHAFTALTAHPLIATPALA